MFIPYNTQSNIDAQFTYPLRYHYLSLVEPVIILKELNVLDFFQQSPYIILLHFYSSYSSLKLSDMIPMINKFVNYQYKSQFGEQFPLNIDISYYPSYEPLINQPSGSITLEILNEVSSETDKNPHLLYTLQEIFSISPFARVKIISNDNRKCTENYVEIVQEIVNTVHQLSSIGEKIFIISNIFTGSLVPPSPDFFSIFEPIKGIPFFQSSGNKGWIIDNYSNLPKKVYSYTFFTAYVFCHVGGMFYSSSSGFCYPRNLPNEISGECPLPKQEVSSESLMSIFFNSCYYGIFYPKKQEVISIDQQIILNNNDIRERVFNTPAQIRINGFDLPSYQLSFNRNIPSQEELTFRVPDVVTKSHFYLFFCYNDSSSNKIAGGSSLSVPMFGTQYAVLSLFFGSQFALYYDLSNNYLSTLYDLQLQGKQLFSYCNENYCIQKINEDDKSFSQVVTDPSGLNCLDYPGYKINDLVGLNPYGLGIPIWKNWVI